MNYHHCTLNLNLNLNFPMIISSRKVCVCVFVFQFQNHEKLEHWNSSGHKIHTAIVFRFNFFFSSPCVNDYETYNFYVKNFMRLFNDGWAYNHLLCCYLIFYPLEIEDKKKISQRAIIPKEHTMIKAIMDPTWNRNFNFFSSLRSHLCMKSNEWKKKLILSKR